MLRAPRRWHYQPSAPFPVTSEGRIADRRIRRLINRIKGDIAELNETERAQINDAVAVVRRHRAALTVPLGIPTLAATPPTPATTASEATA